MLLGAVAQLGEHLLCKQGVTGSIPVGSTSIPLRCGTGVCLAYDRQFCRYPVWTWKTCSYPIPMDRPD